MMFIYQLILITSDLRDNKSTEYVIASKSETLFKSWLGLFYKDFVPGIKCFGYKIGIQFSITAVVAKENNYLAKILNFCIAYDIDYWPKVDLTDWK